MLNTDWAQVEIIDLINDGSGLAFGIIGGRSTGVVVKTILPGGVADRDGRLQSGDHILQIGEVNLRGLGSEQVASVLRQCGVYVRMVVARPVESATLDIKTLNNQAPIVPTKILGDPVELDKYLIENGYVGTCTPNPSSISRPIVYNRQDTISDMIEVIRNPISISKSHSRKTDPTFSTTVQKNNSKSQDLPETETFTIELEKDDLGLGITVAGYVCEKEAISGIFVKSISKGSAADAKKTIQVNDRIIEVNGVSVIGQTNHQAVEFLKNTGAMVKLKFERYLRGPKFEQLQQAIKANERRLPSSPPSPTLSSLPKVPLSAVQMSYLAIEPEMESQSSMDFDSAVIFDCNEPEDEEREIVIDGTKSPQFSISCHQDICDKWKNQFDKDVQIVIAEMHKDENSGLGISLEGTVDVEDGKEVRPHHYIRNILQGGPVGSNGTLQSGDELLEVNGIQLLGMNHFEVVATLKQLPNLVKIVCARYPVSMRIIDTSQDPEAFKARKIICESLQTLIQSAEQNRLVKAKSESSIASSLSSEPCTTSKSRSLELITGLPMWSDEATTIELIKGDHGLGFSILDYQDPLNPQETVIVIRSLVPGGVAQTDGRLVPGDRLLAVNDVNVERATLDSAVQVLKRASKGIIKITVAKPLNGKDTISDANQDSEDHTCLDDFQECIEEFQDLINVPMYFEDDRSFNYSPSTSQVEDLGEKKFQMYNHISNTDLLENNYLNIKELTRDSIGDSDIDISFKSTNDNFLDQRNNDCDNVQLILKKQRVLGNIEKNDSLTQSEKPSLSDKDDYDTGMDESLSADNVKTEQIDNDKLNLELEDLTPTNSKVDISNANVFVDTVSTKISSIPSSITDHLSNTKHLYLSSKLDNFVSYNQQQSECICESDEFFLVECPSCPSDSVNKSNSETNVSETINTPLVHKLTYKLREYYNDYENCLDAYKDLTVYEKIQEELSDSQIFDEIFLPFKCRSAPDILDHSFITMTYDRGPDINRRKSVFTTHNNDVSYIKNSCEMTVIRQIEPDYENMKGQENNSLLKHWGSSHMVKVFREPGENLGISIVGGKVDVQPSNKQQQERSQKLLGIFVKNVKPNSPAEKTGQFKTGDRILEVSGIDLREASHDKAVEAIRNSSNPVVLIIQSLIPWVNNENDKNVIESSENSQTNVTFSHNNNETLSLLKGESLDIEEEHDSMPSPKGVDAEPAEAEERIESPMPQVHSPESDTLEEPENVVKEVRRDLKDTPPVTDESSSEDDEEVNAIEMEGRTVSAKGYQIDRASAANVRRNKDEMAADKEEEDDFGYTMNKVKKKYGNLGHTVLMVQLERTSSGLGISLAGHRDRSCMAVFVCGLNPKGAAYRSGSIQIGDEILEVNGVVLHGRCHLNASAIIKSLSGPVFKVIILRRKTAIDDIAVKPITQFPISLADEISEEHFSAQYNNVRTVTIKKTNQSLGIMIIEGKHAEVGQGIFISDIQEGSLANKAGLEIGEMILAVNKDSLVGSNYDTAANLLKRTEGLVSLIVSNPGKKDPSKLPAGSSNTTSESKLNANLKTSKLPSRPTTPVPEVPADPTTCPITPGYETTIEITTNNESLGVFFIGGKDTAINDGIILHELYPGGAAQKDGRLQPGDQILEVNGASLRNCSYTTASQALRQTLPKMKITVFRPTNLEYIPIEVEIMKKPGKGLGLSVVGRKTGNGVYIADIVPGGQAESDGKITKGDLLISINGQNLENVTSEEAGAILKTAMGKVVLKLHRYKTNSRQFS